MSLHKIVFGTLFFLCFSTLTQAQSQKTEVEIVTKFGTMRAILYNETPRHRDHFIKLAQSKYFDGSLFTRVIPEFMIQGGSLDSKGAPPGTLVGSGSSTMQIAPEIRKDLIAKKGALCAPRQPDKINPKKLSDASQFFIVQGKVYTRGYLDTLELSRNIKIRNAAFDKVYLPQQNEMDSLKTADPRAYNARAAKIRAEIDSLVRSDKKSFFFSEPMKEAYSTVGGAMHIDGQYTIFGEVIEGLDIIDKIAALPRDGRDRPKENIEMKVRIIKTTAQ